VSKSQEDWDSALLRAVKVKGHLREAMDLADDFPPGFDLAEDNIHRILAHLNDAITESHTLIGRLVSSGAENRTRRRGL